MSRTNSNLGAASPPVLVAAGAAVGAVAASSLLLAFRWINSRGTAQQTQQQTTQQPDHINSKTLSTSTHPSAASSSLSTSSTVPPLPPPRSRSHSAARFEGSVSRIASDTSYLEENEYEPNDNHLLHDDDESHPSTRLFPHHPSHEAHGQNSSEPLSDHDVYLCPHCSNYINSLDLIPAHPEDDEYDPNSADPGVSEAETQRILSAAEQLNIQLALKDSLHKIFQSVDEDNDGVITRDQMGVFLTKLGLTGEREQAFLNIVGGDSVQFIPNSSASSDEADSAPSFRRSFSTGPLVGEPHSARAGEKEKRGSGSGAKSMVQVVGINFKQFFDRFQDTLGSIDDFMHEAANGVDGATASSDHTSVPMVELNSNSSSPPALSPTHSNLLTPPRGYRLTVNTLTPNTQLNVATSDGHNPSHRPNSNSALFSSPLNAGAGGSLASSPAHAASNPAIRVFLGGACGETTWRKDIAIPQFQTAGVSFYNPQVKDWNQKLVALEGLMKAWCKILFFVVGSKTRALASMIEVASLIAAGRRVVLVIEPIEPGVEIEGQVPSGSEVKDLNRAREYLRDVANNYSIPVHTSADAGVKAIIAMEEEERREARARLATRNSLIGVSGGSARRGRGSVIVTGSSTLTSPLSPGHRKNAHSGGQPFHSSSAATASSLAAASQLPMHHSHSHHHHSHHHAHAHSHSHLHTSQSHGHHTSHAHAPSTPTASIAHALEKEHAASATTAHSEPAVVATGATAADVESSTATKHHSAAKKKDRKKH